MDRAVPGWCASAARRAAERYRLFGSEARGKGGEGSDIDILVLVDGFDLDTWKSVHDMAYSISPWLSPLTEDYERCHAPRSRPTGLYKAMREESIRL